MITTRTLVIVALGLVLSTPALHGQDRSRYRDFQLASDLASVSALASVPASEAKTIHQRPALMQELTWRRPYVLSRSTPPQNDPVRQIVFSFYHDQLSMIVVDYDHDRTLGMTDGDMIEAISRTYGLAWIPTVNKTQAVTSHVEAESGTPVARWGDSDVSVVLYRSSDLYGSSSATRFRLIVTSPQLEALAQIGDAQAIRLDASEAPQREIARQKKQTEDTRVAEEKARIANKAAFRP
jgi:hypothetical protein